MTTKAVTTAVAQQPQRVSLLAKMAARYHVEPEKMRDTLAATAFKGTREKPVTNEQMMALLIVADQYGLNPWLKEIHAFPDKSGGIVPFVGVDGWLRIINEHPQFADMELEASDDDPEVVPAWFECRIFRKDRSRPTVIREYFAECKRDTDPWRQMPRRMLRHKAIIQCARVAFAYTGIHDPDEAERIAAAIDVTPTRVKPTTEAPKAKNGNTVYHEVPVTELREKLSEGEIPEADFLKQFGVASMDAIPLDKISEAFQLIERWHRGS